MRRFLSQFNIQICLRSWSAHCRAAHLTIRRSDYKVITRPLRMSPTLLSLMPLSWIWIRSNHTSCKTYGEYLDLVPTMYLIPWGAKLEVSTLGHVFKGDWTACSKLDDNSRFNSQYHNWWGPMWSLKTKESSLWYWRRVTHTSSEMYEKKQGHNLKLNLLTILLIPSSISYHEWVHCQKVTVLGHRFEGDCSACLNCVEFF